MTAPDELQRVVERLNDDLRLNRPARLGTVAVSDRDLRALLSERAELLATVERMRGALGRIADERSPFDHTGEPLHVRISKDLSRRINEARAALTTGEGTSHD